MSRPLAATARARQTAGPRVQGLGFLLVTAFGWGFNWPVMRLVLTQVPPFSARAVSAIAGTLVAFAAAALLGERLRPPPGQWVPLLISTGLNFAGFAGLAILAVRLLNASEAVIVVYTLPLWSALLAWPMLGERPTPLRLAALAIGLAGVAVLMGNRLHFGDGANTLLGIGCGLGASMLFALGTVLTKRRPLAMPPLTAVAWQIGLASMAFAAAAQFETWPAEPLSAGVWLGLLYLATVPLTLSYYTWFRALHLLPASTAAIGSLLVPIIGVCTAAWALGEPLGTRQLLALALTVAGVALAARA